MSFFFILFNATAGGDHDEDGTFAGAAGLAERTLRIHCPRLSASELDAGREEANLDANLENTYDACVGFPCAGSVTYWSGCVGRHRASSEAYMAILASGDAPTIQEHLLTSSSTDTLRIVAQ